MRSCTVRRVDPNPGVILIFCPLSVEARAARRALKQAHAKRNISVYQIGVGPNLADRLRAAIDSHDNVRAVILAGLAGAIAPTQSQLRIAEVITPDGVHLPPLRDGTPTARNTKLIGVDTPVLTPQAKRELYVDSGAHLVDCESHNFVPIARAASLPWAIARGVSDAHDVNLPAQTIRWMSAHGNIRPMQVLFDIIRQPSLIPALARLKGSADTGLTEMCRQLIAIIEAASRTLERMDEEPDSLPIPAAVRSVLVYGGAFDPPHIAHIQLPPQARDALNLDFALYIPTATTPLKGRAGATGVDRIEMLKGALASDPRAAVSSIELSRGGVSYTIDTLAALRERAPHVTTWRLLIGADQAAKFHQWRDAATIFKLVPPVVMLRSPDESKESLLGSLRPYWSESELSQWGQAIVELPAINVSSTKVRTLLASDPPDIKALSELLAPETLEYITQRALYKTA